MEEILMKVKYAMDLFGVTPFVMAIVLIFAVGAAIRAFLKNA